jgi:hypothetical protein
MAAPHFSGGDLVRFRSQAAGAPADGPRACRLDDLVLGISKACAVRLQSFTRRATDKRSE